MNFDKNQLIKLAQTKMPFGKFRGKCLIDLPENYIVWFESQGFPEGEIGNLLKQLYEIKVNGLEYLIRPLKNQ
jgi:uncharacterized protein (DUF3820 family)